MIVSGLVNVFTQDIEVALDFYQGVLGLPESFRTPTTGVPEHVEMTAGDFVLGVSAAGAAERVHGVKPETGHPVLSLVFWVDDVEAHDLGRIGPFLENHPLFPEQANISLAEVTGENALKLRTWERGVGLTKACGSAACAAAVSAARKGLTGRTVSVALPGGTLVIDWRADDHVVMTGPCAFEHEGTLDLGALV